MASEYEKASNESGIVDHTATPQSQRYTPRIAFTNEEMRVIESTRREMFYKRVCPSVLGGVCGAYYLMRKGLWSKHPQYGFLPKMAGAGVMAYLAANIFVANSVRSRLKNMDGNFARAMRGEPPLPVGESAEHEDVPVDQTNESDGPLGSILNQKHPAELPTRSLTYDDLRRKNRLHDDIGPSETHQRIPPSPKFPMPAAAAPPSDQIGVSGGSEQKKKNQYGDAWTE